jgi:hypothetical protein
MAAAPHFGRGGPRGRALALTVVAGNRQALSDHDSTPNVIVWQADDTAGASRYVAPVRQKMQWLSAAGLSGAPPPPKPPSWRHKKKPAAVSVGSAAATRAPANVKAMPCRTSARISVPAVSRCHQFLGLSTIRSMRDPIYDKIQT